MRTTPAREAHSLVSALVSPDAHCVVGGLRTLRSSLANDAPEFQLRGLLIKRNLANVLLELVASHGGSVNLAGSKDIVEGCCHVLLEVMRGEEQQCALVASAAGSKPFINLLRAFAKVPRTAVTLCEILQLLAAHDRTAGAAAAKAHGGVELLLSLSSRHSRNGEVQRCALQLLHAYCRQCVANCNALLRSPLLPSLVTALKRHVGLRRVCASGLTLLTTVSTRRPGLSTLLARANTVTAAFEAAVAYPSDAEIVSRAMTLLVRVGGAKAARGQLQRAASFHKLYPLLQLHLGREAILHKIALVLWRAYAVEKEALDDLNQRVVVRLPAPVDEDPIPESASSPRSPRTPPWTAPVARVRRFAIETADLPDVQRCERAPLASRGDTTPTNSANREEAQLDCLLKLAQRLEGGWRFVPETAFVTTWESLLDMGKEKPTPAAPSPRPERAAPGSESGAAKRAEDSGGGSGGEAGVQNGRQQLLESAALEAEPAKACPAASNISGGGLRFESRFECGNLSKAVRLGPNNYSLLLSADSNSFGQVQWFYFAVYGMVHGQTYHLSFDNLEKPDSLFNYGMQPVLYCPRLATQDGMGWIRVGADICYLANPFEKSVSTDPASRKLMGCHSAVMTLTLPEQVPEVGPEEPRFLAYSVPYSYTMLRRDLATLRLMRDSVRQSSLCETLSGNDCPLVTITNFENVAAAPEGDSGEWVPYGDRCQVFLSARVHPGETNASWAMRGALKFLAGSDPVAQRLRNRVVFKIVPMLNPDGVIAGNHRCNLAGHDLNRQWSRPNAKTAPTVFHLRRLMWAAHKGSGVKLFVDMHGHSRKPGIFLYGCEDPRRFGAIEHLFPHLVSRLADPQVFHLESCAHKVLKSKSNCARVAIWRDLKLAHSFTLEVSMSGNESTHFSLDDLEQAGRDLARAIWDLVEPSQAAVAEVTRKLEAQFPNRFLGSDVGSSGSGCGGCGDADPASPESDEVHDGAGGGAGDEEAAPERRVEVVAAKETKRRLRRPRKKIAPREAPVAS